MKLKDGGKESTVGFLICFYPMFSLRLQRQKLDGHNCQFLTCIFT